MRSSQRISATTAPSGNAYPTFERGANICAGPVRRAATFSLDSRRQDRQSRYAVVGFAGAAPSHLDERDELDRPQEWPAITMVVFRNYQWAPKSATRRLYDNNFVGTELDPHLSYARVAGLRPEGRYGTHAGELSVALETACAGQKDGSRPSSR